MQKVISHFKYLVLMFLSTDLKFSSEGIFIFITAIDKF